MMAGAVREGSKGGRGDTAWYVRQPPMCSSASSLSKHSPYLRDVISITCGADEPADVDPAPGPFAAERGDTAPLGVEAVVTEVVAGGSDSLITCSSLITEGTGTLTGGVELEAAIGLDEADPWRS